MGQKLGRKGGKEGRREGRKEGRREGRKEGRGGKGEKVNLFWCVMKERTKGGETNLFCGV